MLKQLYYTLIFPYLNYGSMSWGNTYSTTLKQLNTKQNNCIRSTFFINNRESALPYYQLLDILKLENIAKLKTGILTHKLFNKPMSVPSLFHEFLLPVTNVHSYNTRYAARYNIYRPKSRTNFGEFTFKYSASILWESIPLCLKQLTTTNSFKRQYKVNLISCQT